MAFRYTTEGLTYLAGIFPKGAASPTTLYLGFFTSQSATTVPAASATGGAMPSGWVEARGLGYARQPIVAVDWGDPVVNGDRVVVTAAQVTFPAAGALGWGTLNGTFLATHPQSEAGDIVLAFANFDDGEAAPTGAGTILKVTPALYDRSDDA